MKHIKSIIKLSLITLLSVASTAFANDASLERLHTLSPNEKQAQLKSDYEEKLAKWEKHPLTFQKHQVLELVAINNTFGVFEVKFKNAGKIGSMECDKKLAKILARNDKIIAGRCNAFRYPFTRKPRENENYYIRQVNDVHRFLSLDRMKECNAYYKDNGGNHVDNPRSFSFKKSYCAISLQYRENQFKKNTVENEPSRTEKRPLLTNLYSDVINGYSTEDARVCTSDSYLTYPLDGSNKERVARRYCQLLPKGTELHLTGNHKTIGKMHVSQIRFHTTDFSMSNAIYWIEASRTKKAASTSVF